MNDECKDYLVRQDMLVRSSNTIPKNVKTKTYIELITSWHHDRNLIEGSTDIAQFAKLIQEAGELSDSICKGKDVSDDIGDMIVVLINIAERNGLSISTCLGKAWGDIKDRKGEMRNGVFVKEADL
jgi:NTP pyrophosphatase (non-canonical NTP hydrolase)